MLPQKREYQTATACIMYWTNTHIPGRATIFLLHGAAMDHVMFNEQLGVLGDYNIIAWDARGHGESLPVTGKFNIHDLAADALGILDELQIKKAIFIGQSEGGMIAQEVYRVAPARVVGIVAIGASPIMLPYSKTDIWLLNFSTSIIKYWPYDNFIQALARKTSIKKDVQVYAIATGRKMSKKDFLSIWYGVTNALSVEGISDMHITVPLLLTYGDHDTTGTVKKNNQRWKAYEPTAELVIIPNAGHNANQDNPAFFNTVLSSYLQQLA